MNKISLSILLIAASLSTGTFANKHTDPSNKNGAFGKMIRKPTVKDAFCMMELMGSGQFGAACAACAASGTTATVFNPLLAMSYSVCVPICVKAGSFAAAALNDCGVKL